VKNIKAFSVAQSERTSNQDYELGGMSSTLVELLPEVLQALLFGSVSVGLSVGSAYTERFALTMFQTGQTGLAAWGGILGAVFFAFAYLLVRDNLAPTVRAIRHHIGG
jgi:hypothetical protein